MSSCCSVENWKSIKNARTARWPGAMAQLKMGAGNAGAAKVSRWLLGRTSESDALLWQKRGERPVAFRCL